MKQKKEDSRTFRNLPVPLTDDELRMRGERLAKVLGLKDDLEDELQAVKDKHKARMGDLDTEADLLALQLRTRTEDRGIEVVKLRNLEARRMETWRLDSRVLVDHRPLDPDEHQGGDWVKEAVLRDADDEAKLRLGLIEPTEEMKLKFSDLDSKPEGVPVEDPPADEDTSKRRGSPRTRADKDPPSAST